MPFGKAVALWATACAVYIVAITGRTSFGVAGVEAIDRFHIDASRLAVFTSVQVGVYALAQVPVGMLIDRLGARRLLFYGALVMAAGQILLGLAPSYAVAIAARVLVGAGDATAFLSVMRLLPLLFPVRRTPLFSQLTGGMGQIGQFLSAVPFLQAVHAFGWSWAFVGLGAVGVIVAAAGYVFLSGTDQAASASKNAGGRGVLGAVRQVLARPVVWQAVFIHWTAMMPISLFLLMWGVPMMRLGMGLSTAQIGTVLTLVTVASVAAGPVHGVISARLGLRRDDAAGWCALAICLTTLAFFAPRTAPSAAPGAGLGASPAVTSVTVMLVVVAFLTPAANYGFDTIRERVDHAVLATATGVANMGGFTAIMIAAQLLGIGLDHLAPDGNYTWADFRQAWLAVGLTWGIGMIGYLASRQKVRARRRGNHA